MKTDFLTIIFSNEFRMILDGADCWARGLVFHENIQTQTTEVK